MKKNDRIIIGFVLIAALLGYFIWVFPNQNPGGHVQIYVEGNLYESISLNTSKTITVETPVGANTIQVSEGVADMIDASCQDQLCVHMKPISLVGETIVCLPHRVHLAVEGTKEVEVDAISH